MAVPVSGQSESKKRLEGTHEFQKLVGWRDGDWYLNTMGWKSFKFLVYI